MKKSVNQLIFAAGVLVLWEGLALLKFWPPYVFPTPRGVGESLWAGFADHSIWIGIAVSMRRVAIGYAISVVLGILLGVLLTWSRFLQDTLGGVILSLQSLPSICWVPLALLWFGLSETAIIFVTVMGSMLAVTQATKAGFDNVPRILSMAGRNLGAKGPQLFWHVLLPASLPYLLARQRQKQEMLGEEMADPLGQEFRALFNEQNLGAPIDLALHNFTERVPLLDVRFFTSSVLLQRQTGGNLSEILSRLAYVIRERFKLRGRIRAVSAHGKMTATALSLIPVAVAVLMFYTNPEYVKFFFTDDVGQIMLGSAVALQLIGYGIMQKIVKIEV